MLLESYKLRFPSFTYFLYSYILLSPPTLKNSRPTRLVKSSTAYFFLQAKRLSFKGMSMDWYAYDPPQLWLDYPFDFLVKMFA